MIDLFEFFSKLAMYVNCPGGEIGNRNRLKIGRRKA
jgi:hypothetical protein